MKGQGQQQQILFSAEQRELRALMRELNDTLPLVETKDAEIAIRTLVSVLSNAVKAGKEQEGADDLDKLGPDDLIQTILARRKDTSFEEAPPKKRDRSVSFSPPSEGVRAGPVKRAAPAPEALLLSFNNATHNIVKINSFGKHNGEYGFFIEMRKSGPGTQKIKSAFASTSNLRAIDHMESAFRYKNTMAVLVHGIQRLPQTNELLAVLEQFKWGRAVIESL